MKTLYNSMFLKTTKKTNFHCGKQMGFVKKNVSFFNCFKQNQIQQINTTKLQAFHTHPPSDCLVTPPHKGGGVGYTNNANSSVSVEYSLDNFHRSNQDTALVHKPSVFEGQWVQSGDLLADCSASVGGELSLGQNILIAYMPWEGYNFEDAILISERLVYDDLYTSIHIERYEIDVRETKLGMEEITRVIPEISEELTQHLNPSGIAKLGSWIQEGDILVGKVTPINKKNQSNYQKLLYTILEKPVLPVRDSSLRAPKGIKAKVVGIQIFKNLSYEQISKPYPPFNPLHSPFGRGIKGGAYNRGGGQRLKGVNAKITTQNQSKKTSRSTPPSFTLPLEGSPEGVYPGGDKGYIGSQDELAGISPLTIPTSPSFMGHAKVNLSTRRALASSYNQHNAIFYQNQNQIRSFSLNLNNQYERSSKTKKFTSHFDPPSLLPIGKETRGVVYKRAILGQKRGILLSNSIKSFSSHSEPVFLENSKKAGRSASGAFWTLRSRLSKNFTSNALNHNKPILKAQKHVPRRLNNVFSIQIYLAEKRRIQVGDKMAGRHGNKGIISQILPIEDMPFLPDGTPLDLVLNPLGVPSRMNVGQIYECLLGLAGRHLGENFKVFPFDEIYGAEASRSFVYSKLYEARLKSNKNWIFNPNTPGKMRLYDGRTGETFHQPVTVGYAYMIRLVHMVDDKIHARSTGPYSLVTQQPLRGRSKQGGQRLGEMEVWALEGYGAAFTLLEMLTIKSDDMTGRMTLWSNLILNKEISIGTPESFKVLICELQALCLDVGLFKTNSKLNSFF
nr:RNA polymerase beta subunit [Chlamydomonas sp. UWO 241]